MTTIEELFTPKDVFTPEDMSTFAATFNDANYKIPNKAFLKKLGKQLFEKANGKTKDKIENEEKNKSLSDWIILHNFII